MARLTSFLSMMAIIAFGGTAMAQDYFDDIYYNPKNDKSISTVSSSKQKKSNYIANMADLDVDAYNRRGDYYYVSQVDTIGEAVENGEDFVYTQQIQKYYNPTIVVDNAGVLDDVLTNAYGNVDIVINNNGYPVFAPWYGYSWPYYSSLWSPWSWGVNIGPWGWSVGWYDPWYSWGWGPSWGWGGPVWGPGPGPAPGWGPGWRPGPGPLATWSPRGNRVVGPRPGWNSPTPRPNTIASRPVGNFRAPSGNPGASRPSGKHTSTSRPSGVINNGGKWEYNTSGNNGHRVAGTGVLPTNRTGSSGATVNRNTGTTNHRNTGTVTTPNRTNNNNSNRSSVTTNRTTNRSTFGSGSRTGGGGRSTGGGSRGGGGGRHR